MFLVLWRNRKHLHHEENGQKLSKEHQAVKAKLGGLYMQYQPKYWWFEMVVMLQKMIMTGAMCVVAQGSSVQLLIAILVMLMYMLVVLKTAPFEEDTEDWSAFVACIALTLTTIGGFALMTDDPTTRTYESYVLAIVLIGINVVCIALEIVIVVVFDCNACRRCRREGGEGDSKVSEEDEDEELSLDDVFFGTKY